MEQWLIFLGETGPLRKKGTIFDALFYFVLQMMSTGGRLEVMEGVICDRQANLAVRDLCEGCV